MTSHLGLAGMSAVAAMMCFQPDTRIALYVAPVWFPLLTAGYRLTRGARDRTGGDLVRSAASTRPGPVEEL